MTNYKQDYIFNRVLLAIIAFILLSNIVYSCYLKSVTTIEVRIGNPDNPDNPDNAPNDASDSTQTIKLDNYVTDTASIDSI